MKQPGVIYRGLTVARFTSWVTLARDALNRLTLPRRSAASVVGLIGVVLVAFCVCATASASRLKWDKPVTLDPAGTNPHLAVSESGRQIAVWEGRVESKRSIRVATKSRNGEWSKPIEISPMSYQLQPMVGIDRAGRGVIVWVKEVKKNTSSLFISRERPDGSWTPEEQLTPTGDSVFEMDVANDGAGRILLTWSSSRKRQKTPTAKAAFLAADTPANAVQIKELPSDPALQIKRTKPNLIQNGPATVILASQHTSSGATATTLSATVNSPTGEWSTSKQLYTATEASEQPIKVAIESNKAGQLAVCWSSATKRELHTIVRSVSGEWTLVHGNSDLQLDGGEFTLAAYGEDEFVVNFARSAKRKIAAAFLRNMQWKLPPNDRGPGKSEDTTVIPTGWSVFTDPSGNSRLFWNVSGQTRSHPHPVYTVPTDGAKSGPPEKTPISLCEKGRMYVMGNSSGELSAIYEFASAPKRVGIQIAAAKTVEDPKVEPSGLPPLSPASAKTVENSYSEHSDLPPLSPASTAVTSATATPTPPKANKDAPKLLLLKPTTYESATDYESATQQAQPTKPHYDTEVVQIGLSDCQPGPIALDPINLNSDGSPSLLIYDNERQKLYRFQNGKLEHIAGNGETTTVAKTALVRVGKRIPATEIELDNMLTMSTDHNGFIYVVLDRIEEAPTMRLIVLSPNNDDSRRLETRRVLGVTDCGADFSGLTSAIGLIDGDILAGSLTGLHRIGANGVPRHEFSIQTFGRRETPAERALHLHRPHFQKPGPSGRLLVIDTFTHRIFRLSSDLQTGELLIGQGSLMVERHLSRTRMTQEITAGLARTEKNSGFSPDGSLASEAKVYFPVDAAEAPDGTVVVIEGGRLRAIKDGRLHTIADHDQLGITNPPAPNLSWKSADKVLKLVDYLTFTPDGDCYVAQLDLGRILKIKTGFVPRVSTVGGFQLSVLSAPHQLSPILEYCRLVGFWVTEPSMGRVLRLGVDGKLRGALGSRADSGASNGEKDAADQIADLGDGSDRSKWRLYSPVAINGMGRVNEKGDCPYLISDYGPTDASATGYVRKLSIDGKTLTTVAGNGKAAGSDLKIPAGAKAKDIAIRPMTTRALAEHDEHGNSGFLVADALRKQVLWIKADGTVKPAIGGGTLTPTPDWQPATKVRIGEITRIHGTNTGALLVDKTNHYAYEYNQPNQQLRVIAGTGYPGYSGDNGTAVNAQLNKPDDLRITNNKIFITDSGNHVIRQIDRQTNTITTIAGTGQPGNTTNTNSPLQAQFNNPTSILTSKTHLYILDANNKRITKIKRN